MNIYSIAIHPHPILYSVQETSDLARSKTPYNVWVTNDVSRSKIPDNALVTNDMARSPKCK